MKVRLLVLVRYAVEIFPFLLGALNRKITCQSKQNTTDFTILLSEAQHSWTTKYNKHVPWNTALLERPSAGVLAPSGRPTASWDKSKLFTAVFPLYYLFLNCYCLHYTSTFQCQWKKLYKSLRRTCEAKSFSIDVPAMFAKFSTKLRGALNTRSTFSSAPETNWNRPTMARHCMS